MSRQLLLIVFASVFPLCAQYRDQIIRGEVTGGGDLSSYSAEIYDAAKGVSVATVGVDRRGNFQASVGPGDYQVRILDGGGTVVGIAAPPPGQFGGPIVVNVRGYNVQRPVSGTVSVRDLARFKNRKLVQELVASNEAAAKRDYAESAKRLERVVAIDDTYAQAYVNLGVRYMQTGRVRAARGVLLRAIELEPTLVMAYTNLALADLNLFDSEAAVQAGLGALRLDPGNELAKRVVTAARSQAERLCP